MPALREGDCSDDEARLRLAIRRVYQAVRNHSDESFRFEDSDEAISTSFFLLTPNSDSDKIFLHAPL